MALNAASVGGQPAGAQAQDGGGPAGVAYQHYDVGLEAHPGPLFTRGKQMAPNPNSLFSESEHPVMHNLSGRQFGGGNVGRPAMEEEGESEA